MHGDATTVLGSIELTELHRIYTDVCNELDIVPTDEWRRDVVAAVVMDLVHSGEREMGAIHQFTDRWRNFRFAGSVGRSVRKTGADAHPALRHEVDAI